MTTMIIGWGCLIISWILPQFFKNKTTGRFVAGALAAFATGVFIGSFLSSC